MLSLVSLTRPPSSQRRRLGLLCGHAGGDLFLVKKSPHSTAFVGLDRARRLKPVGRPKSAKSPQPTAVLFRSFGDPDSEHSSGRTKLSVRAKPMSVFAESSPTKRCVEMGVRHGVWQKVRLWSKRSVAVVTVVQAVRGSVASVRLCHGPLRVRDDRHVWDWACSFEDMAVSSLCRCFGEHRRWFCSTGG